jgi:hypothetical protein
VHRADLPPEVELVDHKGYDPFEVFLQGSPAPQRTARVVLSRLLESSGAVFEDSPGNDPGTAG